MDTTFSWLTCAVNLPSAAPEEWKASDLQNFYSHPNNPEWGPRLSRILYHESIHFWQLLSSGYLANQVLDEWNRLIHFETHKEISPPSRMAEGMCMRRPGDPFTAAELVECWARYWDVHTRSPAKLIDEEKIEVPSSMRLTTQQGEILGYTSAAFDLFMQKGKDAEFYAAPYRWMLSEAHGHSAFVNIVFPALVFFAFGTPDPVTFLQAAFQRCSSNEKVQSGVADRTNRINLDWLNNWGVLIGEVVEPTTRALRMPFFTAGWDVLRRGRFSEHPCLSEYQAKLGGLFLTVNNAEPPAPQGESEDSTYNFALLDLAKHDPRVLFAFPGQPVYRLLLGSHVPPPCVHFENFSWYASSPSEMMRLLTRQSPTSGTADVTLRSAVTNLEMRTRRFYSAVYAVSIGLPAHAFEKDGGPHR